MTTHAETWEATNRRALTVALDEVRADLVRFTSDGGAPKVAAAEQTEYENSREPSAALEILCNSLGLSPFERWLLLFCAGMEVEEDFAELLAAAVPGARAPSFALALAVFPKVHWSALSPDGPLRRLHLLEVGEAHRVTQAPLRIAEFVLHYLMGLACRDPELTGLIEPMPDPETMAELSPSQSDLADEIASACHAEYERTDQSPLLQLHGKDDKRPLVAAVCERLELVPHRLYLNDMPADAADRDRVLRLWERQVSLFPLALVIERENESAEQRDFDPRPFIEELDGVVFIADGDRGPVCRRLALVYEAGKPTAPEQTQLWLNKLRAWKDSNGYAKRLSDQFSLNAAAIEAAWAAAAVSDEPTREQKLWDACRAQARPNLDSLARRIDSPMTMADLVLPSEAQAILEEILLHVRHRAKVFQAWGFQSKFSRGAGLSALFTGVSGTGKTMAAEALANELNLDLYHVDLSALVSKYVGETEKHLRRVFDAAETGGLLLLFDEADALFGKRGEVKDSHDRYANIQVSYLLQRMESYRGLAILTTNLKDALDHAFARRIRFKIDFPFPDANARAAIWRNAFPAAAPVIGLNFELLARLNATGASIRNIALAAAFRAVHEDQAVSMRHLLDAARAEFARRDKQLTEADVAGWVEKPA